MRTNPSTNLVLASLTNAFDRIISFIPQLIGRIVILIIGIILAAILRAIVIRILQAVHFERWFRRAGVLDYLSDIFAANLIQILFTGVVITVALGAGLAIGFGGQDAVR